jgi:hypothetical protein
LPSAISSTVQVRSTEMKTLHSGRKVQRRR